MDRILVAQRFASANRHLLAQINSREFVAEKSFVLEVQGFFAQIEPESNKRVRQIVSRDSVRDLRDLQE